MRLPHPSLLGQDQLQARLLQLAGLFLGLNAVVLTLAPAARQHSWAVDYRWGHWLALLVWAAVFGLAHHFSRRWLPECDPYLLPIVALLTGWGLLLVWRLAPAFGLRQTAWLALGGAGLIAGLRLPDDLSFLRRFKYVWLAGSLLLMGFTLLIGVNPMGSGPRMWLGCCGIYLQPSEPLKLLLVAYLAAYLAERFPLRFIGGEGQSVTGLFSKRWIAWLAPTVLMTGLALLLLLAQRDLGTAIIFLFLYTTLLYAASGQVAVLGLLAAAALIGGVIGYGLFDVVRVRVDAWLNPWADPSGRSYQIVQALMAIAHGGLPGRGLGMGNPGLVPLAHSDLIFAALAEEFGLAGSLGLLLLIGLLMQRGLRAAQLASDAYRRYLAVGLTAYLAGQALLIIGGSLRMLPLTGVTLPFLSYGGSSLLVSLLAVLLLLKVSVHGEQSAAVPTAPQVFSNLGLLFTGGLMAAALISGWWAIVRAPVLLARTDNPRRAIADRFVRRGSLLDRQERAISASLGRVGEYQRQVFYPALSNIVGYTNPTYGQSGLEAALDGYLRGLQGNPPLLIWWHHLLYGQPPPGRDVRLSLDLDLQKVADRELGERTGAVVVMNAASGEILALASHPGFDANTLEADWGALIRDPRSPLLNRAVAGQYPAADLFSLLLPGQDDPQTIEPFLLRPRLDLPEDRALAARTSLEAVTPLQVAGWAAALSAGGQRPAPQLALAVNTPEFGWLPLPAAEQPLTLLSASQARSAVTRLAVAGQLTWQAVAVLPHRPGQMVSWFAGGTLPEWGGSPLAVVVLLEENQPAEAQRIGRTLLAYFVQP